MPNTSSQTRTKSPLRWIIPLSILGVPLVLWWFFGVTVPTSSMENGVLTGDRLLMNKFDLSADKGDVVAFDFPGGRDEAEPRSQQTYLMRAVATAGDLVEVKAHRVWLDGKPAEEPATLKIGEVAPRDYDIDHTFPAGAGFSAANWGPMRVPKKGDVIPLNDSTFVMWRVFIGREGHQASQQGNSFFIDGSPATSYTVERDYIFTLGDYRDNSLDGRFWGFVPVDNITGHPLFVIWSYDNGDASPDGNGEGFRSDRIFKSVE